MRVETMHFYMDFKWTMDPCFYHTRRAFAALRDELLGVAIIMGRWFPYAARISRERREFYQEKIWNIMFYKSKKFNVCKQSLEKIIFQKEQDWEIRNQGMVTRVNVAYL